MVQRDRSFDSILPYTRIVGQDEIKRALELAYIDPRIGGVLISGKRGTAKSTAVRGFALMTYGELPVTLPINATEDRVVGGWQIEALMRGETVKQDGLLKKADGKILYIDEVNLLEDHLVNIILDVVSTGVLEIQREGKDEKHYVSLTLVGTMNPEEGVLRPQLLDRFGLMVQVESITDVKQRGEILDRVLEHDKAIALRDTDKKTPLDDWFREDDALKSTLEHARKRLKGREVEVPNSVLGQCVAIAGKIGAEGHRGELTLALAARALAAMSGATKVTAEHVREVAPLALQHRRAGVAQADGALWGLAQKAVVDEALDS